MDYTDLSDEQKYAFSRIASKAVNKDTEDKRPIVMGANAGSGKSATVRAISSFLTKNNVKHVVVAMTGRACAQIQKDGISNVMTCHSLMLKPLVDADGNLIRWEKKDVNEITESAGSAVIVDEASMLTHDMYSMLSGLNGVSLIMCGDSAQLPPIEMNEEYAGFNVMDFSGSKAELLTLTRNFRQESGSGIADLSMHLRANNSIPRKKWDDVRIDRKRDVTTLQYHQKNHFDIIMCGINKTRKKINTLVREARGYHGEIPSVGETVICKKNDIVSGTRINNGELYTVTGIISGDKDSTIFLEGVDNGVKVSVVVANETWSTEKFPPGVNLKENHLSLFTWGYCVTVHAAQGSQFDNVLFVDEDVSFFIDRMKFRYTAVSRAKTSLVLAI